MRAILVAANCADREYDQESWCALHSISRFDASFPMQVAMVLRQVRTVYKTSIVCLLFPKIFTL